MLDFLRAIQQIALTIISSASITWSLSKRSQLPPDLANTTNSFQLWWGTSRAHSLSHPSWGVWVQLPALQCSSPLGLWVTKVKLFVFKCHGGLWPWESHNGGRLQLRTSLPNCDHWLVDNPFMGCCSTIAVQQPIQSESQNQAQGYNSPPTSLKHGEIYCFHRNKSVWCPHSSCIPHWWASAPSCWGFKQVSTVPGKNLEEKQEALPAYKPDHLIQNVICFSSSLLWEN